MTLKKLFDQLKNNQSGKLFSYVQDYVNASQFNLQTEVLNNDNRFTRALVCCTTNLQNYDTITRLIVQDDELPVFSSHMALIKCSCELFNPSNTNENLSDFIADVMFSIKKSKSSDPGTTLSFAAGFVLGNAIKRGVDAKPFFEHFNSDILIDNDKIFSGLCYGLNGTEQSLIKNLTYLNDLNERYDNWTSSVRKTCFNLFKEITTLSFSSFNNPNQNNFEILQSFTYLNRNEYYDRFVQEYKVNLDNMVIKSQLKSKNFKNDSKINNSDKANQYKTDGTEKQLKLTVKSQLKEIEMMNEQLENYKKIMQQFEQILPTVTDITKNINDKNIFQNIQKLVEQHQKTVNNLQEFKNEHEKSQAIKLALRKHF